MRRLISISLLISVILFSLAICLSESFGRQTEAAQLNNVAEGNRKFFNTLPTGQPLIEADLSTDRAGTSQASLNVAAAKECAYEVGITFTGKGGAAFSCDNAFFDYDVKIVISAPEGSTVYYTLDCSEPNESSEIYEKPIVLNVQDNDFAPAYHLRAVAKLKDGSFTRTAARTFFVQRNIEERFSTMVICVSGEPEELTELPDGIFAGENYEAKGRESERKVYIEARDTDGLPIFEQFGGVRVKGGSSRHNAIKGMRLYARKEYDEYHKTFRFSGFGTRKLDGSGGIIDSYGRMTLRHGGTDTGEAYIREELCQTLARKAGLECTEGVVPVAVYLNGSYYGPSWLHEDFSDKRMKEKYGDASGRFYKIEGSEREKDSDNNEETARLSEEYTKIYYAIMDTDLTVDANYRRLCDFIDVEDCLDYYAWNIAVNNADWPSNNYRLYRYVGEKDETILDPETGELKSEVFDGRWRCIYQDMDYSFGRHGMTGLRADYNTFLRLFDEEGKSYSPLFVQLMNRKDCRNYFRNRILEFLDVTLSCKSITETYYELHASRRQELDMFFRCGREVNPFIVTGNEEYYNRCEEEILKFAEDRAKYLRGYLDEILPEL